MSLDEDLFMLLKRGMGYSEDKCIGCKYFRVHAEPQLCDLNPGRSVPVSPDGHCNHFIRDNK